MEWLRDHYVCPKCGSIPRERALLRVLTECFPGWRDQAIHESSPGRPASELLRRSCPGYLSTHYFPDAPLGEEYRGSRNEDLARQTLADDCFDIVITQDVMEHVLDPPVVFREIARTLKPSGCHVFTTPIYPQPKSEVRVISRNGRIEYLAEPEYHDNPIDLEGSLVTVRWGQDIGELIFEACGMITTIHRTVDRSFGLDGEFLEVLVSRNPSAGS